MQTTFGFLSCVASFSALFGRASTVHEPDDVTKTLYLVHREGSTEATIRHNLHRATNAAVQEKLHTRRLNENASRIRLQQSSHLRLEILEHARRVATDEQEHRFARSV